MKWGVITLSTPNIPLGKLSTTLNIFSILADKHFKVAFIHLPSSHVHPWIKLVTARIYMPTKGRITSNNYRINSSPNSIFELLLLSVDDFVFLRSVDSQWHSDDFFYAINPLAPVHHGACLCYAEFSFYAVNFSMCGRKPPKYLKNEK